jgi:integrase
MNHQKITQLTKVLQQKGALDIQKWLITGDGIKRQYTKEDGTRSFQRLPKGWYQDLDESGKRDLLDRLNAEDWRLKRALDKYEIQSAFIPPKILAEFETKLYQESNPQTARTRLQNLKLYCLEYFLPKSPNPIEWQRDLQTGWVEYLVDLDYAPSTYKHIRTALNKFMKFLAAKTPDLPYLQFDGLTPYQIAEIKVVRELAGLGVRKYINQADYSILVDAAPDKLRPYIQIAYSYGVRRNELLALETSLIRNQYLSVGRQLKDGKLALPKYRKPRKVPHWFMTPRELYACIQDLTPYKDYELSEAFTELTTRLWAEEKLRDKYVLHDCRHSFCSNAVKAHNIHEVMLAAGHSDLRVTSAYLKDTRELADEIFDPTKPDKLGSVG